ncbi:MAG: Bro-N domain-containing protein [Eubacteriales bacterium]
MGCEKGDVLFCASDVAKALGYKRPNEAVSAHAKGTVKHRTPTSGGIQELSYIFEPDVYRLIVKSKLPASQKFEVWVLCSAEHNTHYAQKNIMWKKTKKQIYTAN